MREIKFRAWNTKDQFMDSAWLVDWEHEKVCHSKHNQSELVDCILLQYTGLKDKNGKPIYEKDLLKDDENFIWKVNYYPGYFALECDDLLALRPISVADSFRLEVIGNVFEHPHLLEVQND